MAAALKLFLVIVAFVCCMQFVEMARLRRDEPAHSETPDIAKTLEGLLETLKNSPGVKELTDKIQNFSADDAKAIVDKLTVGVKSTIEQISKETANLSATKHE